jgi:hypothetical protein
MSVWILNHHITFALAVDFNYNSKGKIWPYLD